MSSKFHASEFFCKILSLNNFQVALDILLDCQTRGWVGWTRAIRKRANEWSFPGQLNIHSKEGSRIKKENKSKEKIGHRRHNIS